MDLPRGRIEVEGQANSGAGRWGTGKSRVARKVWGYGGWLVVGLMIPLLAEDLSERRFYRAENPQYTILGSAIDSIVFTLTRTVRTDDRGHLVSISSFVGSDGCDDGLA